MMKMNLLKWINVVILILLLISMFTNVIQWTNSKQQIIETVKTDTIVYRDTITKTDLVPKYIANTKIITDTLKTTDTIPQYVEVEVPIEQQVYTDSDYYAVISGFKPHLDTLKVFPKETTITIEKMLYKQNKGIKLKPSINCGVGYGFINKKPDVFIGAGISITF